VKGHRGFHENHCCARGAPQNQRCNLEKDRASVAAALDRIEQQRQGREYLVDHSFTIADLTAASLLGPLLQPPEIQYPLRVQLPSYVQQYRATVLKHPAAQWAARIFRLHRGRSAETPRAAHHIGSVPGARIV